MVFVYIGSNDNNLYAFNASTGALLWSYTTGGEITGAPAVVHGIVYLGSMDGKLYALKAKTGTLLWSYTTAGSIQGSPAISNSVVYIGSGQHSVLSGTLYALNASTELLVVYR